MDLKIKHIITSNSIKTTYDKPSTIPIPRFADYLQMALTEFPSLSAPTCPSLVVLEDCGAAVREAAGPAGAAAEDARGRLEAAAAAAVVVPERHRRRGGRLARSAASAAAGRRVRTTAENVVLKGETSTSSVSQVSVPKRGTFNI